MAPSFDATAPAGHEPLRRLELCTVCTSLLVLILFAILVVHRSAFQETRHTDATVYFRATWALRTGASLYEVADENQLHYAYPPLLAILLAPLADAPSGVARDWQLPYEVSVSLWILLMIMATALAIDWFARPGAKCAHLGVAAAAPVQSALVVQSTCAAVRLHCAAGLHLLARPNHSGCSPVRGRHVSGADSSAAISAPVYGWRRPYVSRSSPRCCCSIHCCGATAKHWRERSRAVSSAWQSFRPSCSGPPGRSK